MVKNLSLLLSLAISMLFAQSATAQSDDDYHPFMSDSFNLSLGFYTPKRSVTLQIDGSVPGEDIDFDEGLRLDEYEETGNLNFRWRFGEKWSVWGQYWQVDSNGGAILEEDIHWEDLVFKAGTFAEGGFDLSIARVFFGRTFMKRPKHEFGLGAGFHWLEMSAYLQGQVLTNVGDLEFERAAVNADFPMPNIGGWYYYSWSPKWVFQSRLDWLSASVGDYSGGLWNAQAGVNWQFSKYVGVGLYLQAFTVNVDIDKSDWRGKAEASQYGPLISISGSW